MLIAQRSVQIISAGKVSRDGILPELLATGFREDFPSVRLRGLKERKVTSRSSAKFCIKTCNIYDTCHVSVICRLGEDVHNCPSRFSVLMWLSVGTLLSGFC